MISKLSFEVKTALIVAHQDDEVFISWLLKKIIASASMVEVFLLSSGSLSNDSRDIETRNEEFEASLKNLGIPFSNIHMIGQNLNIFDNTIHNHLGESYEYLYKHFIEAGFKQILVPCFEGGHQDHDSCNFLARELGKKFVIPVFSFSLYNGHHTSWKFFKCNSPIEKFGTISSYKLSFADLILIFRHMLFYSSQKITWIGLFPMVLLGFFKMRFHIQTDNQLNLAEEKPHSGELLYERYDRARYSDVAKRFADFISKPD